MKDVQHVGETKLNCFWHCYQSFRICLYVRIILMKLYYDAMKVSTLVPIGKKKVAVVVLSLTVEWGVGMERQGSSYGEVVNTRDVRVQALLGGSKSPTSRSLEAVEWIMCI